jgi:hypothetical protein
MVPIGPHGASAAERRVDSLGEADRESLEARTQRRVRVGFDEDVNVVGLHAEVEQSEAVTRGTCERCSELRKETRRTERRDIAGCAQRHVHGAVTGVHGATAVRDGAAAGGRLAAGAPSATAPGTDWQIQLSSGGRHLIGHILADI